MVALLSFYNAQCCQQLSLFGQIRNLSLFRDPLIKWVPNHDSIRFNPSLIDDYSLNLTAAHWVVVERSIRSVQCRTLDFQVFYDGNFLSPTFLFWTISNFGFLPSLECHWLGRGLIWGQSLPINHYEENNPLSW